MKFCDGDCIHGNLKGQCPECDVKYLESRCSQLESLVRELVTALQNCRSELDKDDVTLLAKAREMVGS